MNKVKAKSFMNWTLTFTKRIVLIVTLLWIAYTVYEAFMIWYSVKLFGNFSYLDTFISDTGETFRLIVGANIVSKTIENVFKYNEGGLFGTSIREETEESEETVG